MFLNQLRLCTIKYVHIKTLYPTISGVFEILVETSISSMTMGFFALILRGSVLWIFSCKKHMYQTIAKQVTNPKLNHKYDIGIGSILLQTQELSKFFWTLYQTTFSAFSKAVLMTIICRDQNSNNQNLHTRGKYSKNVPLL